MIDQSATLTEFDICVLRDDGKEAGLIGGGSFEGVNLEKARVMLTQLADAIGDCEKLWRQGAPACLSSPPPPSTPLASLPQLMTNILEN
jgi:hypothetical protein